MRIDDPQVLRTIQQLEEATATLRRLAGFEPLNAGPEVKASRAPVWCPHCALGFQSPDDLEHHLGGEHRDPTTAVA